MSTSAKPNPRSAKCTFKNCVSCYKSESNNTQRLMACAGCRITYYCSRECQRKDWPIHKLGCLSTDNAIKVFSETTANKATTTGLNYKEVYGRMAKWQRVTSPALTYFAIEALDLYNHTERILSHMFWVDVVENHNPVSLKAKTPINYFKVQNALVLTISGALLRLSPSPGMQSAILKNVEDSRQLRARNEGLGILTIMLHLVTLNSVYLLSIKVDTDTLQNQRKDWKDVMKQCFEEGSIFCTVYA